MNQLNSILNTALDIGELMLKSGAEVWRVEDTITRICNAYGCDTSHVFSITSLIVATATKDQNQVTQSRRIKGYETNLKKVEDLNELSRHICSNTPSFSEINSTIHSINTKDNLRLIRKFSAHIIISFVFTIIWGGKIRDALAAVIVSLLIFAMDMYFNRIKINRLAYTLLCSLVAGFAATGLNAVGLCMHTDKVVIGNVMLLIPGISLTNGIRDLLCGDIVSGLLRLCESILIAISIAVGFAIPLFIVGGGL